VTLAAGGTVVATLAAPAVGEFIADANAVVGGTGNYSCSLIDVSSSGRSASATPRARNYQINAARTTEVTETGGFNNLPGSTIEEICYNAAASKTETLVNAAMAAVQVTSIHTASPRGQSKSGLTNKFRNAPPSINPPNAGQATK
jgi:hypothetical protein